VLPCAHIAYIAGVGDNVAPMLEQLGVRVTLVDPVARAPTSRRSGRWSWDARLQASEASSPTTPTPRLRPGGGTLVVQ
jgi:hypothetical protein